MERQGARSPAARFASASWAVRVTICGLAVRVVGVPPASLGSAPGQLPVPSASNTSPAGRLAAAQGTAPLPPVAAEDRARTGS